MRESNFSNPIQNKACVCISAAIYDRRALDCTATLPLINSLNHLAYLTSTSPRIREMVCLDGGLERLIRILRQVPRSPSQPPMRGVITKEMQSVWKWSLAFQCVVNIGVRGSENVRTRVVEAGMVPVAVRVLESYLRIADAIRDERRREARREEAKLRLERAAESALLAIDVATPTAATSRRAASDAGAQQTQTRSGRHGQAQWLADQTTTGSTALEPSTDASQTDETRPTTPAEGVISDFMMSNSSSSSSLVQHQDASIPASHPVDATVAPILPPIDGLPVENGAVSPSSSSSSAGTGSGATTARSGEGRLSHQRAEHGTSHLGPFGSGTLTNVSSVEDFTASGSGSDGADDGEAEGGDESDTGNAGAQQDRSDEDRMDLLEERTTPRPPRRPLAPAIDARHGHALMTSAGNHPSPSESASGSNSRQPSRPRPPVPLQSTFTARPTTTTHTTPTAAVTQRLADPAQTPRNIAGAHLANLTHGHADRLHTARGEREREGSQIHPSDMIYREEEVLLSLQLLAYLSKYAHVRTLFHRDLSTLNVLDPLDALDGHLGAASSNNVSWTPNDPPKKNVFCIAERYTLRSSRTGLSHFASLGESRIAPEIQYWAGVIMRNACRKDEKQGGIRQCANMLCGKWEKQPREFAKCRRCRKAKYCSKQCQSKGWQMGHRFWCSARSDDDHGEGKDRVKERPSAAMGEPSQVMIAEDGMQPGARRADNDDHNARHHRLDATGRHVHRLLPTEIADRHAQNRLHDRMDARSLASDPLSSDMTDGSQEMRRNVAVGTRDDSSEDQMQDNVDMAPLHVPRRGQSNAGEGSSSGPSLPSSGRRAVSAIPQHLQLPSHSGDHSDSGNRSRTVSAASSSADVSDISEDEMERASRRVLASTIAPVHRSPAGVNLTSLANVHTANDFGHGADTMQRAEEDVPTRTDLAGRPLPPPVIARHDGATNLDMNMAPDNDLLNLGRLTPAAAEDVDAGVFGRGDFDQMIWRGRTPSLDDGVQSRTGPGRVTRHAFSSQDPSASQDSLDDADASQPSFSTDSAAVSAAYDSSPSMLNSALLLAGQNDAGTPRFPSTSLHAPIARQAHRFASVNVPSSNASSSSGMMSPLISGSSSSSTHARGTLASTFGDWRARPRDALAGPSSEVRSIFHPVTTARPTGTSARSSGGGALGSAPASALSFGALQNREGPVASQDDQFIVPGELQSLFNTVESRSATARQTTVPPSPQHNGMDVDV